MRNQTPRRHETSQGLFYLYLYRMNLYSFLCNVRPKLFVEKHLNPSGLEDPTPGVLVAPGIHTGEPEGMEGKRYLPICGANSNMMISVKYCCHSIATPTPQNEKPSLDNLSISFAY